MIIRLFFVFLCLFFKNYANAELTSEELERYNEQGISEVISAIQQIGAMKQSLGEYEDIRVRYMTERFGDGAPQN